VIALITARVGEHTVTGKVDPSLLGAIPQVEAEAREQISEFGAHLWSAVQREIRGQKEGQTQ
jgi:hypothetical protein